MIKDEKTGLYRPAENKGELINTFPKIFEMVDVDSISLFDKDSSDVVPNDWREIAKATVEPLKKYDGVVITHGTDTMHYTSAALSFMLKNLCKPVVLTGSQIPSGEPNSDAFRNLYDACKVAGYSNVQDVCIVFNSKIIKGNRARKLRTKEADAFESINYPLLGTLDDSSKFTRRPYAKESNKIQADTKLNERVGYIRAFPGMDPEIIDWFVKEKYKGIVIEGFGSGHANTKENSCVSSIGNATKKGVPVFLCTQCTYGKVELKYDVGRKLKEAGAVGLGDILPEVAVVKLMYVTGHYTDPETVRKKMTQNIAGEMTL